MSKAKIALAGSVGIASLLTGSAAHVARGDTVTFQNGVNGYTGTFDRKIGATTSNDRNGSAVNSGTFFIDGGQTTINDAGAVQGLIRFDNIVGPGAIPANALIISASLDMVTTTGTNSQSNGAYTAYRMDTPFDATTTYASLGNDGIYNNVGRLGGSFNRPKISTAGNPVVTSARVDEIVQDWVSGTATNNGFGIRSDNNIDGWSPTTTGSATVANRPKLTVNYTTNPAARRVTYQQNVNGYTGTTDSFINGINGSTVGAVVYGSSVEHGFLDGKGFDATTGAQNSWDQPYLAKFDNIDLSMPAVTRADLVLHTGFDSDNSGTNGSFSIHRILKPWDLSTNYASLDSDGDTSHTPVAELIANGFIAPAATETGQIGEAATLDLDVTSIVQAWKDGAPNYGFYIGSTGTADGWELYSSGAFAAVTNGVEIDDVAMQLAPQLSILYVPPSKLYWDTNGATAGAGGATPSGTWDGTAANFTADANGSSSSTFAATSADVDVVFAAGTDGTGAYTVTVSGTQSAKSVQVALGSVTFTGGTIATPTIDVASGASATVSSNLVGGPTGSLTKTGLGALNATRFLLNSLTVDGGTVTVAPNDGTATGRTNSASKTALTITAGSLDLKNNSMVVVGNTDQAIRGLIKTNKLITTSTLAGKTTGLGYAQGNDAAIAGLGNSLAGQSFTAADVAVKYTYFGDGDLDGDVDVDDVGKWVDNFTGTDGSTTKVWTQGDWDYDGDVDVDDVGRWVDNFTGTDGGVLDIGAAAFANAQPQALADLQAMGFTVVPEPTSLGLLGLGVVGLRARRRRWLE